MRGRGAHPPPPPQTRRKPLYTEKRQTFPILKYFPKEPAIKQYERVAPVGATVSLLSLTERRLLLEIHQQDNTGHLQVPPTAATLLYTV